MTNRLLTLLIALPVAVILIVLSVANRGVVSVTLDPFNPGNPALTYTAPLFLWVLGALLAGIIIGGLLIWFTQGRHRKLARKRKAEADALLTRAKQAEAKALPPASSLS
ncbi:LapA family protein [Bacillus subtilis]|uniref:lipopolysaccharide assembly protein LapA domain-containing protein n=1 Tax=Pseudochrobactrum asaccharolyticum TaxID=354351 RepID=UPI001F1B4E22|nr:LapA family protein [Pseudochrobactrum asaccharolyticum]MCF7644355.1 LapA family protein [Pseudochrobactrum asaccharolyticum]MCF7670406.1 LapA family protein [Bacillus subtilis]